LLHTVCQHPAVTQRTQHKQLPVCLRPWLTLSFARRSAAASSTMSIEAASARSDPYSSAGCEGKWGGRQVCECRRHEAGATDCCRSLEFTLHKHDTSGCCWQLTSAGALTVLAPQVPQDGLLQHRQGASQRQPRSGVRLLEHGAASSNVVGCLPSQPPHAQAQGTPTMDCTRSTSPSST
jgi:hypothetical protein